MHYGKYGGSNPAEVLRGIHAAGSRRYCGCRNAVAIWPIGACNRTTVPLDDPVAAVQLAAPTWQPYGEHGAECGSLQVPLDWGATDGDRIALAHRLAADPGQRIGALFFNPGGPGSSAVSVVRNGAPRTCSPLNC